LVLVTDEEEEEEQSDDKETSNKAMEDNCNDTEDSDETSASNEEMTKINPKVKQDHLVTERWSLKDKPVTSHVCQKTVKSKLSMSNSMQESRFS